MTTCPVCGGEMTYRPRYPQMVCKTCHEKTTDRSGRPVVFYNTTPLGHGCRGEYRDTGEAYGVTAGRAEQFRCYVDGVACTAFEGYFGGVVVVVAPPDTFAE